MCITPRSGGIPIRPEWKYHERVAWRATSIKRGVECAWGGGGGGWKCERREAARMQKWTVRDVSESDGIIRKRVRTKSIKVSPYTGLPPIYNIIMCTHTRAQCKVRAGWKGNALRMGSLRGECGSEHRAYYNYRGRGGKTFSLPADERGQSRRRQIRSAEKCPTTRGRVW